jgi:hypothetical protein
MKPCQCRWPVKARPELDHTAAMGIDPVQPIATCGALVSRDFGPAQRAAAVVIDANFAGRHLGDGQ